VRSGVTCEECEVQYKYSKHDRVNGGGLIDVYCLGNHSFPSLDIYRGLSIEHLDMYNEKLLAGVYRYSECAD
jgi:hypothetical protein